MSPPAPRAHSPATLGAAASAIHLACDAACSAVSWARPPYLRLEDMPEAFRYLPFVSAPVAVSLAASAVSGVLALIALATVEPGTARRRWPITRTVGGFWLFTALLSWLVWLSTPFLQALPGIALGVPRAMLVGYLLWRGSGGDPTPVSGAHPAGAA